jgi:hypothetical protein
MQGVVSWYGYRKAYVVLYITKFTFKERDRVIYDHIHNVANFVKVTPLRIFLHDGVEIYLKSLCNILMYGYSNNFCASF